MKTHPEALSWRGRKVARATRTAFGTIHLSSWMGCSLCGQQTLHLEPNGASRGSECSLCGQQTPHLEPNGASRGSECSLCGQQTLHLEPTRQADGMECRPCCQQTLHLEPTCRQFGSKCSLCGQHKLRLELPHKNGPPAMPTGRLCCLILRLGAGRYLTAGRRRGRRPGGR